MEHAIGEDIRRGAPSVEDLPHPAQPLVDADATEDQRTYALLTHLCGLLGLIDMLVLGLVAAIVMWRIKAKESAFIDDHGREAVNFQLSLLVYMVAGSIAISIVGVITIGIGFLLFIPGVLLLVVLRLVGSIRGAYFAGKGHYYRYPMCIRFLT